MEQSRFMRFDALICSATKSVQKLKSVYMDGYQLSAAHTDCLCRLAEHPQGMTQTELSAAEEMDRAQVSRVMRKLTEQGFTAESGTGGYKKRYCLTPRGAEAAREIQTIIGNINRFVSHEIPEAEIANFYRTFERVARGLQQAAQAARAAQNDGALPFTGREA